MADHVGKPKVECAAELARLTAGDPLPEIQTHGFLTPEVDNGMVSGVVFLAVDSMEVRRDIWRHHLKGRHEVSLVVEVRMDLRHGMVYTIVPWRPADQRFWESKWYPDSEVVEETTACGGTKTAAPTAMILSSFAVWQFIRFINGQQPEPELIVAMDSPAMVAQELAA